MSHVGFAPNSSSFSSCNVTSSPHMVSLPNTHPVTGSRFPEFAGSVTGPPMPPSGPLMVPSSHNPGLWSQTSSLPHHPTSPGHELMHHLPPGQALLANRVHSLLSMADPNLDNRGAEILENWRQFQQAAIANNLDPNMLAMYHSVNFDPSGNQRRKNATRETTSTLKAWLKEHKKNPYPTKGEKIMLAIITRMTLTQISTWFANARRRLKKEHKMTWTPRNRPDGEDNGEGFQGDGGGSSPCAIEDISDGELDLEAISDTEDEHISWQPPGTKFYPPATELHVNADDNKISPRKRNLSESPTDIKKPKIWSIVDTLRREDNQPRSNTGSVVHPSCNDPKTSMETKPHSLSSNCPVSLHSLPPPPPAFLSAARHLFPPSQAPQAMHHSSNPSAAHPYFSSFLSGSQPSVPFQSTTPPHPLQFLFPTSPMGSHPNHPMYSQLSRSQSLLPQTTSATSGSVFPFNLANSLGFGFLPHELMAASLGGNFPAGLSSSPPHLNTSDDQSATKLGKSSHLNEDFKSKEAI